MYGSRKCHVWWYISIAVIEKLEEKKLRLWQIVKEINVKAV
jgi:hypothetical protein